MMRNAPLRKGNDIVGLTNGNILREKQLGKKPYEEHRRGSNLESLSAGKAHWNGSRMNLGEERINGLSIRFDGERPNNLHFRGGLVNGEALLDHPTYRKRLGNQRAFGKHKENVWRRTIPVFCIASLLLLGVAFYFLGDTNKSRRIVIDGKFEDWKDIKSYKDEKGDNSDQSTDILEYKLHIDRRTVAFYVKTQGPIFSGNAQEGIMDTLRIFIDSDNSTGTGYLLESIGADRLIELSGCEKKIYSAEEKVFVDRDQFDWNRWKPYVSVGVNCIAVNNEIELSLTEPCILQNSNSGVGIKIFFNNWCGEEDSTVAVNTVSGELKAMTSAMPLGLQKGHIQIDGNFEDWNDSKGFRDMDWNIDNKNIDILETKYKAERETASFFVEVAGKMMHGTFIPARPYKLERSENKKAGNTVNNEEPNNDLDGDGVPDNEDPDIDGDGVPNEYDLDPYDPTVGRTRPENPHVPCRGEDRLEIFIDIDNEVSTGLPIGPGKENKAMGVDLKIEISGKVGLILTKEAFGLERGNWTKKGTVYAAARCQALEVQAALVLKDDAVIQFQMSCWNRETDYVTIHVHDDEGKGISPPPSSTKHGPMPCVSGLPDCEFIVTGSGRDILDTTTEEASVRFVVMNSGNPTLIQVRIFGTTWGTPPQYRCNIETDDGGGKPSGTPAYPTATVVFTPGPIGDGWQVINIPDGTLTTGTTYHIRIKYDSGTIDSNNKFSINWTTPKNPKWIDGSNSNANRCALYYDGSIWTENTGEPVYVLDWSGPAYEGNPYFGTTERKIYSTTTWGNTFTVSLPVEVTQLGAYIKKFGSPTVGCDIVLYRQSVPQGIIASLTIPAASITASYAWFSGYVTPVNLVLGETYAIYLAASSGSNADGTTNYFAVPSAQTTPISPYQELTYDGTITHEQGNPDQTPTDYNGEDLPLYAIPEFSPPMVVAVCVFAVLLCCGLRRSNTKKRVEERGGK